MQESETTKYVIRASIATEGVVEKPDVIGAVFGQTEGLLGEDLDLRDLQKSGRIGRIEVNIETKGGKTKGEIVIPSSLDKTETAILAASLETIDRIGPCVAAISVAKVEDLRASKRKKVVERAKALMQEMTTGAPESSEITGEVKASLRVEEISTFGPEKLPAGPAVEESDAIIIVEGRADVLNLLRGGIKNTVAIEGTNVPPSVAELTRKKTVTAFVDSDRGGDLILKELFQVAEIDFVARPPEGRSVEDLTQKEIIKALRGKIPADSYKLGGRRALKEAERRMEARPAPRMERAEAPPPPRREATPAAPVDGRFESLRTLLQELNGSLQARLLDAEQKPMKEAPVREVVDALQATEGVQAVVFDGIITQRILDAAEEKKVGWVAGIRIAEGVRVPQGVRVVTAQAAAPRADFGRRGR
ncbi:MAG: DNA primase DnaG [Halobacteria archaeon]